MNRKSLVSTITRGALIGALYYCLSIVFSAISYGPLQFRPAELLCATPLLMPESIVGLTIGCLLTNITSPFGIYDIIFGTLCTLSSSILTYATRNKPLLALSFPVVINAVGLPLIWLLLGVEQGYLLNVLFLAITQGVVVYGLGYPTYLALKKTHLFAKKGE